MKTQNTEIQKHNNIVSITATEPWAPSKIASPPQPAPESLDPDAERRRGFVRESIERKQRADSFFHSLNAEQRAQLLDWLQADTPLTTIMNNLSEPPPKGFGVKVHLTSLRRFRSYYQAMNEALRTEEILDTVNDMDRHCDLTQQPRIQQAVSQMLHEKAFELARTHPGSEVLGEVLTSITKLAALDHKREKLLLDRQKLLRSLATSSDTPKHHRVDLNIIPPTRPLVPMDPPSALQIEGVPEPNARQIADPPKPLPVAQTPVPLAASAEPVAETAANPLLQTPVKSLKIGRNDPCPCGSGQKYEKCCLIEKLHDNI
jgi:uncharacterized protein YecA (UPF0149 family)